ncbi:MAG: helix-turn-helix transcriptional regulator [Clostridia bacterium]|nr:helix-turn-helix transcriptional regulator [Clostridia bacterium]
MQQKTTDRLSVGERTAYAVADFIEAHYREKFSLQTMAGSLFLNESYLVRIFRKHTGYTPLAYHNHLRCERARELLEHSRKSISDIGEETGFVSPAHFTHVFRRTEGCSPTEYRLRTRDDEHSINRVGQPE